MPYALFPSPRKARFGTGSIDLTQAKWVKLDPRVSATLKRHTVAFAQAASHAFAKPLQVTAGEPRKGQVLLTVQLAPRGIEPQGYELSAGDEGLLLSACDEAGLFYGLQTLEQLISQAGAHLPRLTIADAPDFPQRGLMLDISRCKVPKMETLFDIVDLMARLKLNQLQLYTEHTFAFSEHEVVWHDASPMTPEEILELDAYCRDRYVELVPNQNSFGHFGRWLRHPEYKHLAECPDGFETSWHRWPNGTTLKPTRASLQLLDSLYGELLPNFTSKLFNVGCDETWELGKGWSKKRCEEGGTTRVYLDFLVKIAHLVRKHKRTMMFWGDIILHQPELIHELPEDVIGLVWGYEFDEAFSRKCRQFKEAGARFYVCPGTSSWNSLAGRTDNCFGNLENAARSGLRHGAIGFLNTDWGDGGHLHYWPISYPGVFMGAALSWSFKANRDADVAGAIDSLALADEAHVLGQLLLDVGRVLNLIPRRFYNCSPFYDLLFREIGKEHLPEGVTASPLKKCLQKFDQLEARLADARPGCEDGELVKAEIKNAIAMARFATRRALAGLDEEYLDRPGLRHALQHAIWQHEELWLARNRRGGLRESSGALRAQLADLE